MVDLYAQPPLAPGKIVEFDPRPWKFISLPSALAKLLIYNNLTKLNASHSSESQFGTRKLVPTTPVLAEPQVLCWLGTPVLPQIGTAAP